MYKEKWIAINLKKLIISLALISILISTSIFAQSTQQQCHQEYQECSMAAVSADNIEKVCGASLEQEKLKCNEPIGQDLFVCRAVFKNYAYNDFISSCISTYQNRPWSLASGCRINYNRCIESSSSR